MCVCASGVCVSRRDKYGVIDLTAQTSCYPATQICRTHTQCTGKIGCATVGEFKIGCCIMQLVLGSCLDFISFVVFLT